jgi:hypothetical protein
MDVEHHGVPVGVVPGGHDRARVCHSDIVLAFARGSNAGLDPLRGWNTGV